jgi:hypothetical protein
MKYLKNAGEVVAFLVGLAGFVYLLGGLVIGLRLLLDGFSFGSVTTILGQLPRQLVITTALLDVVLPAAGLGLFVVMLTGIRPLWGFLERIGGAAGNRAAGTVLSVAEDVGLLLLAVLLAAPAYFLAERDPGWWVLAISGVALAYTFASLGWPRVRRFDAGKRKASPGLHAIVVFAFFAMIGLVPATVLAASLQFDQAHVCTTPAAGAAPGEELIEGQLIGEGGGEVLLEESEAGEQWVINVPAGQVTKSEYGDVAEHSTCKAPSAAEKEAGQEAEAKAEAEVGPHGGATERRLAAKVRPYLFFDAKERWRPLSVDSFVTERFNGRGHELCTGAPKKPDCEPLERLAQLRPDATVPSWINIHGEGVNGAGFESPDPACHAGLALDCDGGAGAAIYYRRSAHEGRWYWDFWVFYRYNDYNGRINECDFVCDDHEGDWEGMVVVTTESLEPEVTAAIYAAHTDRIYVPPASLPTVGGHPLGYVAEGTHATYPYICDKKCDQYSGLGKKTFPDGDHGGQIAWGENAESACEADHCVRALPGPTKPEDQKLPQASRWAAWPGTWGKTCPELDCGVEEGSSPRSPGLQARFRCPWVANLKAFPDPETGLLTKSRTRGGWRRERAACLAERAHG